MRVSARVTCVASGAVLAGVSLLAQTPPSPVHWSASGTVPVVVPAGALFQATLLASIDPGWHLYASQQPGGGPAPMVISIAKEDSTELIRVGEPHARYGTDPQYSLRTAYFERAAKFKLYLRSSPVRHQATQSLHVYAHYQACNDRLCLPPQEAEVTLFYQLRP